jgi:hypothetical protein
MELKDALNEVDYLTVYPNDAEIEVSFLWHFNSFVDFRDESVCAT